MTDEELAAYQADEANYSIVNYRLGSWTVPVVTGHRLYLRWSYGLDFTKMRFEIIDWLWEADFDADIELEIPFWDQREAIYVDDNAGNRHDNQTFTEYASTDLRTALGRPGNVMGANVIYNATAEQIAEWNGESTDSSTCASNDEECRMLATVDSSVKKILLTVSRNNEPEDDDLRRVDLTGVRCIDGCPQVDDFVELPLDLVPRFWSDPSAWENLPGRIPQEGDAVVVESGWNMIMDIE